MLQPKSERLYFGGHLTLSKKVFYWGFVWGGVEELGKNDLYIHARITKVNSIEHIQSRTARAPHKIPPLTKKQRAGRGGDLLRNRQANSNKKEQNICTGQNTRIRNSEEILTNV